MSAFCDVTALPPAARVAPHQRRRPVLGKLTMVWPTGKPVETGRASPRAGVDPTMRQPGPDDDSDVGGVLYIGIDTGYADTIDTEQAAWLVEMVEMHLETVKDHLQRQAADRANGHRAPCHFTGSPGTHSWRRRAPSTRTSGRSVDATSSGSHPRTASSPSSGATCTTTSATSPTSPRPPPPGSERVLPHRRCWRRGCSSRIQLLARQCHRLILNQPQANTMFTAARRRRCSSRNASIRPSSRRSSAGRSSTPGSRCQSDCSSPGW